MKYLLLLLISFSVFGQYQIKINPNDSQYAKMQIDCNNPIDCNSKLVEWIGKQDFFTGEWNDIEANAIANKIETIEEIPVTKYYHANNYKVKLDDISNELEQVEVKKQARKAETKELKELVDLLDNYGTVAEHRQMTNKILKRILKDMKDD